MKKGLKMNIASSCTSQNSTAILSSNMDLPPCSSSFSSFTTGSRAIDRHNPIITDERRSGNSSSCTTTPIRTPCTNNVLQQKPTNTPISVTTPKKPHQSSPKQKKNKLANKLIAKKKTASATATVTAAAANTPSASSESNSNNNNITIEGDDDSSHCGRGSLSKPSDLIMKAAVCTNTRPVVDYISPPESSRYLLDDTSFLEVLSDFDPALKLMPYDSSSNNNCINNPEVGYQSSEGGCRPPKPFSSPASSDQVVVLRVSLHCRGCEKKMKKHLSRMAGVTSFNIDFAAKKVTVVGDVTPLGVLASISKVKTAKLWTPAMPSPSQLNSENMQLKK